MAQKIDPALLKQLNDKGAAVYDLQGKIDLNASIKKIKEIKSGVAKPQSFGLEKNISVIRPGPTIKLSDLSPYEKPTFSLDPSQQKLSQIAMAREIIKRQTSYSTPTILPSIDKNKIIKGIGTFGRIITAPSILTGIMQEGARSPAVAKTVGRFAADVARAPVRAITSIGLELAASAISLATGKRVQPVFTPETKIDKMLFGDEPIKGAFLRVEESQQWIEKHLIKIGVNPEIAKRNSLALAPFFVAGSIGLDLTPFGGEKNTAKLIAESRDAGKIVKYLKPMFNDATDDVLFKYADELKNITNTSAVKDFILKRKISENILPSVKNIGVSTGLQESKNIGANEFINKLAKDNAEFAKNPVLTAEEGKLVFRSGKDVTKINPKILGVETLVEGEKYAFTPSKTLSGTVEMKKVEAGLAEAKTTLKVGDEAIQAMKETPTVPAMTPVAKEEQIINIVKDKPVEAVIKVVDKLPPKKQSKFITTVLDSDNTSPALKEAVAKTADKMYDPITNKATFDEAKEFVDTDFQGALDYFKTTKQIDAKYNAVGQTLAKQADAEGRYGDAIEIINDLRKNATEKGQFIQAFSVWDKMSPEGMLYFAQKEIDKANDAKGIISKLLKKKDIKLSEETAKFISDKMKSLEGMTDDKAKAEVIKEVFEKINDQIPISVSEIFDAYRYQNMLSSPRTQERNIYFNLLQSFITRPAQMAVETPIDWIRASLTGTKRERYVKDVPVYYKNVLNSVGDGIEAFKEVWAGKPNIDVMNPDFQKFRMNKLPKSVTVVSRFMEGMDQFFRTMIGAGEKAVQLSHGATEEKAVEEALRISKYSLLKGIDEKVTNESQGVLLKSIDDFTKWIQQGMNTKVGKYTGMRWFIPFVNTPMKFMKQWIEYSPLGVATLVGNARKQEQVAKALMGSMVTLYGAKLALDGKTTWSAPTNPESKKLFYASGRKPYSVEIGGKHIPLMYFGPFGLAMAIPAIMKYRFEDSPTALTDSTLEKVVKTIGSGAELFSQQTFMQGLGKYIDLISGNADYKLPGAVAFTLGQVIPLQGLDRYITSIIDPTYRQVSGLKESFQKDIPFASKKLPPIESVGGEVSTRDWWNYFLPFDVGKNIEDYDKLIKNRNEASQIKSLINEQDKLIDRELGDISRQFKLMTPEARRGTVKEIYQRGGIDLLKDLIKKLQQSKKIEDLEIDFYKSLEIKSGLRSMFINEELTEIGDDKEEKRIFLTNLIKNKILTTEVMEQLVEIKKQKKIEVLK